MLKIINFLRMLGLSILLGAFISIIQPGFNKAALAISGQYIAELTNQERAKMGLDKLNWNGSLASSANAKAVDMCSKDYWAHNSPNGATPWTFISAAGYNYTAVGENLAKDFMNDADTIAGWMSSASHRQNILNNLYKDIGVATKNCTLSGKSTALVVAHYGSRSAGVQSVKETAGSRNKKIITSPTVKKISKTQARTNDGKATNSKLTEKRTKPKQKHKILPTDEITLFMTLASMLRQNNNRLFMQS